MRRASAVATALPQRYLDPAAPVFTCEAELRADRDIPVRAPRDTETGASWRVLVEEWESFPGDPADGAPDASGAAPERQSRLVYADQMYL
ncbi:hypothetical protein BRM3_09795 [Brachybacterium huguangmaarense]|uniref:Uncharacterized protein n=1 Tax=Brachybacterium huguangmaarense TaxID=1652028 RepID=A0ABY6FZT5_9MICO|nr:hypothetical protein [Brachybacterium huguangmaarense]UYG15928.1 hypothetical protein BRM3_09795 [Brachybacterium huguangmaarense]